MAKRDTTVPVYLITGFLDGGKTTFLKSTMEEDYFNDGSKTLLILCEEGEEEYSPDFLKKTKTVMVSVENEEELTEAYFAKLQRDFRPERVLIEYNGMWSVNTLMNTAIPKNWLFYQIITVLDGENFKLYLNNIKNIAIEMLRSTDLVLFNRCAADSPLTLYMRTLRSVNTRADLIFEDTDGNEMECPEPDLPYKIDGDIIDITDENYATFYLDLPEHPERYNGKKIRFTVQVMRNKNIPDDVFIGGRRAMTCCEADIRFLPYIFKYDKAKSIPTKSWADVTAVMKWEYNEGYKEEGPVFYIDGFKLANVPADEVVYF